MKDAKLKPCPRRQVEVSIVGTLYPGIKECGQTVLAMTLGGAKATDSAGKEYNLSATIGGLPWIHAKQSGRTVTFSWEALLAAAKAMGIDEQDGSFAEECGRTMDGSQGDQAMKSPS